MPNTPPTDPTYNEDLREFILTRHRGLTSARRIVDELIDATHVGKFTDAYKAAMRDEAVAVLQRHFPNDAEVPELASWTGDNTPQRIYRASGGAGLVIQPIWVEDYLFRVKVTDGGEGYTAPPAISFESEGGTGAEVSCILGAIAGVTIEDGGEGYTSQPTATISAPDHPDGEAATFYVYRGRVERIDVDAGGSGYTAPPTITVGPPETNNPDDQAKARAVVSAGAVVAIELEYAGVGYTETPTVTITGGGGTGAAATVVVQADVVSGMLVTDAGSGYSTAPTITVSGGGGSGAVATAVVDYGTVGAVVVKAQGTGYVELEPGVVIAPGAPATPPTPDYQRDDDRYLPPGWSREPVPATLATPAIYRSERCRLLGAWSDWSEPTIWARYLEG